MIDILESRMLLADMTITATGADDILSLKQTNASPTVATIEVSNGGSTSITVKIGTGTSTLTKGTKKSFMSIGNITLVDLGNGNDKFTADKSVKIPMTVSGGDGKDTITSGSGADVLSGDKATGTGFNDTVNGGAGNDTIYGYGGIDFLYGNDGSDSIRGGNGNDRIDGGANPDKLFGELNDDQFAVIDGSVDILDGGDGRDTSDPLDVDGDKPIKMEGNYVVFGTDNPDGYTFSIFGTNSADTIVASVDSAKVLHLTINGFTSHITLAQRQAYESKLELNPQGGGYNPNRIFINGGGGNDTITAGAGLERIAGSIGNDTITVTAAPFADARDAPVVTGDQGNDKLIQTSTSAAGWTLFGDDTEIDPSDGNDTLIGSTGNDTLLGGGGNDSISGGGGKDSLEGDGAFGFFDFIPAGIDTIEGGDGDDTLLGGAGKDILSGGSGADVIFGNDGADRINGGTGNDVMVGEAGNDTLFGDDGLDNLFGSADNDELHGGKDNDNLVGGIGNDGLFGDDGNDKLDLGQGNDFADGGAQNDTFVNQDGAKDTIKGGSGTDTASKAVADGDVISEIETLV